MFGENFTQQIGDIPLSNKTISCRISDMAIDVKKQLLTNIMQSQCYALQLDEKSDVAGLAQLLTVCHIYIYIYIYRGGHSFLLVFQCTQMAIV